MVAGSATCDRAPRLVAADLFVRDLLDQMDQVWPDEDHLDFAEALKRFTRPAYTVRSDDPLGRYGFNPLQLWATEVRNPHLSVDEAHRHYIAAYLAAPTSSGLTACLVRYDTNPETQ